MSPQSRGYTACKVLDETLVATRSHGPVTVAVRHMDVLLPSPSERTTGQHLTRILVAFPWISRQVRVKESQEIWPLICDYIYRPVPIDSPLSNICRVDVYTSSLACRCVARGAVCSAFDRVVAAVLRCCAAVLRFHPAGVPIPPLQGREGKQLSCKACYVGINLVGSLHGRHTPALARAWSREPQPRNRDDVALQPQQPSK